MDRALQGLINLMDLEPIEENLFRGQSRDLGWGRIYGGQVLGQALRSAAVTVPAERIVHSLHAYFLRPGDPSRPVVYDVDRIRDGGSLTTRRVVALQKGQAIFNLAASFQVPDIGIDHQTKMPDVPRPESLRTDEELIAELLAAHPEKLPDKLRTGLSAPRPFDVRSVDFSNPLQPTVAEPRFSVWFRAKDILPPKPALHEGLLAWASDYNFLVTALRPHAISWLTPGYQMASLDHAMWFHRPIELNRWHLFVIDSPNASATRAFVRGEIFREDGVLVASVTQEGIVRRHRDRAK